VNVLTAHTHRSELQVITALKLISTLYSSLHAKSLPAVSSPAVLWKQLLTVEILQLHVLKSSCYSRSCRIPVLITYVSSYKCIEFLRVYPQLK
jgi:hypothetical protein